MQVNMNMPINILFVCAYTPCTTCVQKEEAGEVRNEVDFKQLKIENQQLSERCDEKNHELLRLKVRAAKTLQILNTYKVIRTSNY